MAAHKQVGDFKVTNVRGKIQRNGGNVVSYFCTPEGRVIYAVVGPVKPEELLKAARWAHETFRAGIAAVGRSRVKLASYIKTVHTAELKTTSAALGGDRVHQLLAARPLPRVKDIYRKVFETLAGEQVNDHRGRGVVAVAARKLRYATKNRKPVLLLLYDDVVKDNHISSWTQQRLDPQVAKVLRKWYLVSLPIDQLPALTQLADVPSYEVKGQSSLILILTDHNGRQLDSIAGLLKSEDLADKLWQGLVRQRAVAADEMAADGKLDAAVKLLNAMLTQPIDSTSRQAIQEQISSLERPTVEHATGQTLALDKSQMR